MAIMKTAISIEKDLFLKAEALSAKLDISRSQLFAQALQYLIGKSETLEVIRKLNEVYATDDAVSGPAVKAGKRKLKRIIGRW